MSKLRSTSGTGSGSAQRVREDEGHALLGEAAMRAQPLAGELAEVVVAGTGAERDAGRADDDDVGLAISRHLEAGGRLIAGQGQRDTRQRPDPFEHGGGINAVLAGCARGRSRRAHRDGARTDR